MASPAASLEYLPIEHLPPGYAVYAALFRDVANAAFLQAQLVARNAAFEYALVDAAAVVSRAHVLAAVFRAVLGHAAGALKTPNVHSETVLSLSPSMNIAEAYRRFGLSPSTKNVLVVKILIASSADDTPTPDAVWAHLSSNVHGTAVPLTDDTIAACTDLDRVRKYYKLNSVPSLLAGRSGTDRDSPETRREVELLALGAMALRGL